MAGFAAGLLETAVDQPLITLKNERQKGRTGWFPLRILYGGLIANALGMGVVTGSQVAIHRAFERRERLQTARQKIGFAALSGALSSLIVSPCELVMDRHREEVKQSKRASYYRTISRAVQREGIFFFSRGIGLTIIRDSGFAVSYLALQPLCYKRCSRTFEKGWVSQIISSIFAGLIGSLCIHPFDTLKTRHQAALVSAIWQGSLMASIKALYCGFLPATGSMITGTFILSTTVDIIAGDMGRSSNFSLA